MSSGSFSIKFSPISAILFTLVAYFGGQLLAGIFFGILGVLLGQDPDNLAGLIEESAAWRFVLIIFVGGFSLALTVLFMRLCRVAWNQIGLGRLPKLSDLGYGVLASVIYAALAIATLILVKIFIPAVDTDQKQILGFESVAGPVALAFVFISLVIIPAVVEEIMIRGFLYSGLRTKLPKIASTLIASAIFGLAHLQLGSGAPPLWVVAIDTFVLSVVLITLRERTGSLWAGMMVHAIKNGLAFYILFVSPNV